ncbi:class F sortase [Streptomyces sp. HSG2]|uniref:class F sortase n=1 Tax=Streptomyces sp. HSG2 TaxID=2797167 RepID=UPI001908FAC3|nr:class F sortase [Streptomyces sp. HSG2]
MAASETEEEGARPRRPAPWGVIALVLLTGLALIRNGSGESAPGPPQPASATARGNDLGPDGAPGAAPLPRSAPGRVRIPAIRVDAPLVPVGLDADGWVDAPPAGNPDLAGWFTGAVTPGEDGTAVVVGHVDNAHGPAVFYTLGALGTGNRVEVSRHDGTTAVFEVYANEVFDKQDFPGDRVYAPTGRPELRVITCGGGFTERDGYTGNVVAFARLVGTG